MKTENIDTIGELTSEDIIDSRDMQEIIDRLEEEEEAASAEPEEGEDAPEPMDPDHVELLKALRDVRDACGSEWQYGVAYIRDSYFKDYAQELADDIGAIDKDAKWPTCCIDWDEAADMLKQDYSSIDIGGIDYWYQD